MFGVWRCGDFENVNDETSNYKRQITNKFQIRSFKFQKSYSVFFCENLCAPCGKKIVIETQSNSEGSTKVRKETFK
jgi:hypothetical protein